MEQTTIIQLLMEIKGDVGEIKGTLAGLIDARGGDQKKIAEHEQRIEVLEMSKAGLMALASGVAAVIALPTSIVPSIWARFI